MLWGGRRGDAPLVLPTNRWTRPMPRVNDLGRCLTALDQDSTLIAVIEMGLKTWLVGALVPGADRQPLKSSIQILICCCNSWSAGARKRGAPVACRSDLRGLRGRSGRVLAGALAAGRGIEAYVIHASSIPVKRDHRRAKTDRLDVGLLMRAFLGWLRGEAEHCRMVAVPTLAQEDAKRPSRSMRSWWPSARG